MGSKSSRVAESTKVDKLNRSFQSLSGNTVTQRERPVSLTDIHYGCTRISGYMQVNEAKHAFSCLNGTFSFEPTGTYLKFSFRIQGIACRLTVGPLPVDMELVSLEAFLELDGTTYRGASVRARVYDIGPLCIMEDFDVGFGQDLVPGEPCCQTQDGACAVAIKGSISWKLPRDRLSDSSI